MAIKLPAGLFLRSAVPGRERWETSVLERRPRLAALLERLLGDESGIISVRANPVTGRILILYLPELTAAHMRQMLAVALRSSLASRDVWVSPMPEGREKDRESRTRLELIRPLLPGSVVAILPSVLSVGLIASLFWLGAGLVAARLAIHLWCHFRAGRLALPLPRLLRRVGRHRRVIYVAFACSVLDKLLDLIPPLLIGVAVNVVTGPGMPRLAALGFATVRSQLLALGGLTVVVWCLESITGYAHRILWQSVAQGIQHDLRIETYAHVQRLELSAFEEHRTGELVTILNDDINRMQFFLNDEMNHLIQVGTNGIVIGAAFLILAPAVAWIAMLPMPLVIWGSLRYQERIRPIYRDVQRRGGRIGAQLVNNLGGMATIKSFTAEEREIARVRRLSRDYLESNQPAIRSSSAFTPVVRMPILVGFAGTLIAGGLLAASGKLQPGTYASVVFMTHRFLWPLTSLGRTVDLYQRAMVSMTRVLDLLDIPDGAADGGEALDPSTVHGEVEFAGVSFAYRQGHPVLRDLSLRIPAGQTAAIVGSTGSGKTTIIKLLLRFYDVTAGSVRLDGRDIRELRTHDIRSAIGLVNQDLFLIDGTVRENIEYGRPGAPLDDIVEAARLAEAHEFIVRQPQGYETPMGERGSKLSAGQRQRICIARALLKNPPIFVFDEATSSVDNETEAAIQRSLERVSAGRTTLLIAHRLSTVRNADRIYVMGPEGRIVEQGTHDDLLRHEGLYASLWQIQCGTDRSSNTDFEKEPT